jgi:serine/threonine protein kinase
VTPNREIKIIDFGLAITMKELETAGSRPCGTPNYLAPEIIDSKFHLNSDIWSLGCILFALLTGSPPFESADTKSTFKKVKSAKYNLPDNLSK